MTHGRDLAEILTVNPRERVIPAVVDANVLLRDIRSNLRRPKVTALLGQIEAGMLRLIVTDRVAFEVETRMSRIVADPDEEARGAELWRDRYLPHARVVDMSSPPAGVRIARVLDGVARSDPDDVPTAHLALLCAPCVVLTGDSDLYDHGFGAKEWLAGVRASGEISDLDGSAFISMRLVEVLAAELLMPGIKRVASAAIRDPIVAALGIAAIVLLTDSGRLAGLQIPTRLRSVSTFVGEVGAELAKRRVQLVATLDPHVLSPLDPLPLEAAVTSELARAHAPLASAELARRLNADTDGVEAALRGSSIFVRTGDRWELGGPIAARTYELGSPSRLSQQPRAPYVLGHVPEARLSRPTRPKCAALPQFARPGPREEAHESLCCRPRSIRCRNAVI